MGIQKEIIETNLQNSNRSTDFEKELIVAGGGGVGIRGRGIVREFGMDTYTQMYLKWVTNLLYSTRNSVQRYVAVWIEVGSLGEDGYMCICG